jgi:hypothetical protein
MPLEALDQRIEAYAKLVCDVASFDKEAAAYLSAGALRLPSFSPSGYISQCFIWSDAPQDTDYWAAISYKLGESK